MTYRTIFFLDYYIAKKIISAIIFPEKISCMHYYAATNFLLFVHQVFNYCHFQACYSIVPQVFLSVQQGLILHIVSSCLYLPSTTAVYVFLYFIQGKSFTYQMVNIIRRVSVILCNRLDILKVIVLCVSTLHII